MCKESLQLHMSETVPNTAASFHGCSFQCLPSLISGSPDVSPGVSIHRDWTWVTIEIDEIEGTVDIPANNDDSSSSIHKTYQFGSNCHVYINSFNACGVKVENSGNYAPHVIHHGPSSSSKLSRPELSIRLNTPSTLREDGSSYASVDSHSAPPVGVDVPFPTFEPNSTFGSPPLLFQLREDGSSYASDDSPSAPSIGIDVTFPTFEQKQPKKRDKLPNAKLMQSDPVPTTLPYPESQPHPINPFLPIHMGLHPNLLSHVLQPFSDDAPNNITANDWNGSPSSTNLNPHQYPTTPNSSQHRLDTNSKSLEHHLDSALAILIQTSGLSTDGVTPKARNALRAINALASMETPTYDPRPFKSVRKVAKWLQIPRSPK